jgi:hypothetical protein
MYLQPNQLEATEGTLLNEVMKLVPYEMDFPALVPVACFRTTCHAYPAKDLNPFQRSNFVMEFK